MIRWSLQVLETVVGLLFLPHPSTKIPADFMHLQFITSTNILFKEVKRHFKRSELDSILYLQCQELRPSDVLERTSDSVESVLTDEPIFVTRFCFSSKWNSTPFLLHHLFWCQIVNDVFTPRLH